MKIGIFSLSCCEGCSVEFLNLEGKILEVLERFNIGEFRLAMDSRESVDIAFVEGAPTTAEEVKKLLGIRKNAAVLVALGSCATSGGVLKLANGVPRRMAFEVYNGKPPTMPVDVRPISDYVPVDYMLPGCPFSREEMLELLTCILLEKEFRLQEKSVCVECSLRENACLLERGELCMGPVTRAGCGAVCPSAGSPCSGCRGAYGDANWRAHIRTLREMGFTEEEIEDAYSIFMGEVAREVSSWLHEE